jgi:Phytanoyl-CoA dioxygenase (PhyH)
MAANLARDRRIARVRSVFGDVARRVGRSLSIAGPGADKNTTLAQHGDSKPGSPIVEVTSLAKKRFAVGVVAVWGWACSNETDFPEGIVEAALDDEAEWLELSNRVPIAGSENTGKWNDRCGFRASLNTFLLSNGAHRLRLRLLTRSGETKAATEVAFRVNNVGQLAQTTARFLKGEAQSTRIWVDLIDSSDFPFEQSANVAWFERADAEQQVAGIVARHNLPPAYDHHLRHFVREGYLVLDGFFTRQHCERINRDLDSLIASGVLKYDYKGQRVEKLFEYSKSTRRLWAHAEIIKVLSAIFDDQALPCQTLNFIHGSQQAVHQDGIHLTPFPQGFMCGVWVALEDIHPDSGPLIVYPGSHRLPRLYTRTVEARKVREHKMWDEFSATYSPKVKELIDQSGLKPLLYTPKAGSVLIWHENLAHGGSPRNNDELTRKSIVSHYFARGAAAFYDSQGTPAWTTPPDDD